MPVLIAAIDTADFMTLTTKDGKLLTRATYQVRNNVKQFLRLGLPKGAVLWSTFVAGKPVKPAQDKNGSIMVPLEKSQLRGQSLSGFPVELVYLTEKSPMKIFGQLAIGLPKVDIPISEIQWTAYFPDEYTYFGFGGDVTPIKGRARPFLPTLPTLASRTQRMEGRTRATSQYDPYYLQSGDKVDEDAIQYKSYEQEVRSIKNKGILPIKVNLPARGETFRFSKLIVTEQESPVLTVRYVGIIKKITGPLSFLLVAGLFVLILARLSFLRKNRKKIKKAA